MVELYGVAETGGATAWRPALAEERGFRSLLGTEWAVVGDGPAAELALRGPALGLGLWRGSLATQGDWALTGDVPRYTRRADGVDLLAITGRKAEPLLGEVAVALPLAARRR